MRRLPGLTPAAQERLAETIASIPGMREGIVHISPDALLAQVSTAIGEALTGAPGNDTVAYLVRKLQGMADGMRGDGKPGIARDMDLLAGCLHGLSLERQALSDAIAGMRAPDGNRVSTKG